MSCHLYVFKARPYFRGSWVSPPTLKVTSTTVYDPRGLRPDKGFVEENTKGTRVLNRNRWRPRFRGGHRRLILEEEGTRDEFRPLFVNYRDTTRGGREVRHHPETRGFPDYILHMCEVYPYSCGVYSCDPLLSVVPLSSPEPFSVPLPFSTLLPRNRLQRNLLSE